MSGLEPAVRRVNPLPNGMVLACYVCEEVFPYQYIRSCPECGSGRTTGVDPDRKLPWKEVGSKKTLSIGGSDKQC